MIHTVMGLIVRLSMNTQHTVALSEAFLLTAKHHNDNQYN
jgi:hypothetical protein